MGATFGAVHIKGAALDRVVACLVEYMSAKGFVAVADDAPEDDGERRILVFEDAGWTTVVDEDLVVTEDAADLLGATLTSALDGDALAITTFHSDTSIVARYRRGERVGRFRVPEDGVRDPDTGHRRVATAFLRDLATSPEAARELQAGLVADRTFPEDTSQAAAALVGLPRPGAGTYLWRDPPAGAVKLRYLAPSSLEPELANDAFDDWRIDQAGGHHIAVHVHREIAGCVGGDLRTHVTGTVEAYAGAHVEGLAIELSGPALALLELDGVAGWNGDSEIVVTAPEHAGPDTRIARFPAAHVTAMSMPAIDLSSGASAAAMRSWRAALGAHYEHRFSFRLQGHARAAGRAELVVRVTRVDGAPLDAQLAHALLAIAPAPRVPLLPPARDLAGDTDEDPADRRIRTAEQYSGRDWLTGWLGFDATFDEAGAFVLDAATQLVGQLGRALEIAITSAGTHPEAGERLRPGKSLAKVALVVAHLRDEADVTLRPPHDDTGAPCLVRVRHQPRGTTIFEAALRRDLAERFPTGRIVPLDLMFSVPCPADAADRASLSACVAELFDAAGALPSCIGGFVTAAGAHAHDDTAPYELLAGLFRGHDEVEVVRRRPRSPGWRVIVPHGALAALAVQPGVVHTAIACGALVASPASDPFAMTDADREAIERTLLPAFVAAAGS